MPSFYSDGLQFNYAIRGEGTHTFFFQHGIGGTIAQPFRFLVRADDHESASQAPPFRLAAFDFRAHGGTPVGDPKKLRIDRFADDCVPRARRVERTQQCATAQPEQVPNRLRRL